MPVRKGSALDPEATKAKVLTAASRLFYERGIHTVGVDEIAERAGASKLSLYRYFRSKEGLVEAVVEERSARIHEWLVEETAHAPPGRARVLALFDALLRWFADEGYHGCAVMNAATETRGQTSPVKAIARTHLRRYRQMLVEQLTEAGVADSEALAGQLLLLIEGASVVAVVEGPAVAGRDARRAAEALLDIVACD
ncbi:TetR/AcrR family transcriptional regulator [Actinomadura meridiana]|uniref:TetR/AcrR family transcriptional regulator n=1 Tax=Actinomadura meridiana TaxID=559626 RepID=A0ABP8C9G0_9ACTN